MKLRLSLLVTIFFLVNNCFSQRTCAVTRDVANASTVDEAGMAVPVPNVIIIPVVVHIVYNTPAQNISNDQVRSQIKVLNEDFRKKNKDVSFIPTEFRGLAADSRIEFRLATQDPTGLATNGINRKQTPVTGFGSDDKVKRSAYGGVDAWDRNLYLNMWVAHLTGGVVGYSSLPGCAPENDGVVISYTAFGTTGSLKAPYVKGRTAVHEIGHWLGLRHIWGDAACGDDRIDDTPPQQGPTRGCPGGVIASCSNIAGGSMYMNFMDFTNDECTNMFTEGQAARMRELFKGGGARAALLSSNKADGAVMDEPASGGSGTVRQVLVYPNPVVEELTISLYGTGSGNSLVNIYNQSGQLVKSMPIISSTVRVDVSKFANGIYYVSTAGQKGVKFVKSK